MCSRSHSTAITKGWWDKSRSRKKLSAFIMSEMYEAFQLFRKVPDITAIYAERNGQFDIWYPGLKPEGVPIDLADTLIRVGDVMEKERVVHRYNPLEYQNMLVFNDPDPFDQYIELLFFVNAWVSAYADNRDDERALAFASCAIFQFCQKHLIEIWEAIDIKMEFNDKRPPRHGDKRW